MKCFILAAILIIGAVSAKRTHPKNVGASFSWNYCAGSESDPIQVNALTLTPDPIVLPGNFTLSIDLTGSEDLTAPIGLDIDIEKLQDDGTYVDFPCLLTILGSCHYDDVCVLLADLFGDDPTTPCPDDLVAHNIPCHCPITAGTYNVDNLNFDLPLPLPEELVSGTYKLTISATSNGHEQICIEVINELVVQDGVAQLKKRLH